LFSSNLRFKSLYSKLALLTALLASSVDIVPSSNACFRIFRLEPDLATVPPKLLKSSSDFLVF